MCLNNVKLTGFKKHTVGYKILRKLPQLYTIRNGVVTELKRTKYFTPLQQCASVLKSGVWLQAQEFNSLDLNSKVKGYGYYPGWHYYLKRDTALKECTNRASVVVKIEVKEIVCVGSQGFNDIPDCGVAIWMKIKDIIYDVDAVNKKRDEKKIRKQLKEMKLMLATTAGKFVDFCFKYLKANSNDASINHIKELNELIKTKNDMMEFYQLVDKLPRTAELFHFLNRLHHYNINRKYGDISEHYRVLFAQCYYEMTKDYPY